MAKILFVSHTANFSKFNVAYIKYFFNKGWNVQYACMCEEEIQGKEYIAKIYKIPMTRNPISVGNIKACRLLKKIIKEEKFDLIHCHTPVGGVVTRIAARGYRKNGMKVIYTAHGFHFYKGAPLLNWVIYYPIEKIMAKYCDAIVTINDEDYNIANKKFRKYTKIYKINGVGIDLNKFYPRSEKEKEKIRRNLGISDSDFVIANIAEINNNKNQFFIVSHFKALLAKIPNVKLLLVGQENISKIRKYVNRNGLGNRILFLGYRSDANEIAAASDITFSASIREGLSISILEDMAEGIPPVCSRNRGHLTFIRNKENGLLFDLKNDKEMIKDILEIYNDKKLVEKIKDNTVLTAQKYSVDLAIKNMDAIYNNILYK